ncbi:MAG: hypothetical protein ACRDNO_20365 [Trebonia sp.]
MAADGGWDVIGLSRRGGAGGPRVRHLAADLLDPRRWATSRRNSPGSRTCSTPLTRTGRIGQNSWRQMSRCSAPCLTRSARPRCSAT